MTNYDAHLFAGGAVPDLDSLVPRPADDVLAVRRVRNRGHSVRVPRQRALLLMAQPRTSAQVHAGANDRAMTKWDTHLLAGGAVPDRDSLVIGPADDVLAVRRVRHRGHFSRVPRQCAQLLIDQTRTSEHSTQQQTIGR